MELGKRVRNLVLVIAFTFMVGIIGYQWIEGWNLMDAVYMTVITLATIGYGETHPLSDAGRVFTIFLILSGLSAFSYGLFTLTSLVAEGKLLRYLYRKRMNRAIAKLQDHYIVCGADKLALHTIEELLRTGHRVVVIDETAEKLHKFETPESLEAHFGEQSLAGKAFYVEGNPTADATLTEANVQHAAGLFCALMEDKDNLFVVLTARGLNPRLRIVAKCQDDQSTDKFTRAGADRVVSPNRIGGLRMASEMVRPTVVSFLDVMVRDPQGYRFEEVLVEPQSQHAAKPLRQSPFVSTPGVQVVALATESETYCYNPSLDTTLTAGQRWVVLGRSEQVAQLRQSLNHGG